MATKKSVFVILALFFCAVAFHACQKENIAEGTDRVLYDLAKNTAGFTWYKNSASLLDRSAGSGHSQPFLRTRYNAIASTQLDSTGKILTNAIFPEGSLVVKELYNADDQLERYAILYKKTGDANADASGWIWGYINASGILVEPSSNQGKSCRTCHNQSNSIDSNLMNKYFP
jgi:hypothetical protein